MFNNRGFFKELDLDTRKHYDYTSWLHRHWPEIAFFLFLLTLPLWFSYITHNIQSDGPVEVIKRPYAGIGSDSMQSEEWGWRE